MRWVKIMHSELFQSSATKQSSGLENQKSFLIGFICECSNENCHEVINLPVDEIERFRVNDRRFILKHGHQQNDVEYIIDERDTFNIVEKYEVPPTTDGHLNHT